MADIGRRLRQYGGGFGPQAERAMFEIAQMLESYAKTHTGDTPRPGRWITRPGLGYRTKARVPDRTAPGGYRYPAHSNRVWRPPGIGWGDITGMLRKSIRGRLRKQPDRLSVELTANRQYAANLELLYNRRWAWMRKAVERNARRIAEHLRRYLEP